MTTGVHELPELLRPAIEKHRDEIESLGRLPEDLLAALREQGAFRLYTPRELGGYEAPSSVVLDVLARIARIDGPTAWIVWNLNLGFGAGLLPPATVERVWGGGADPLIANSGSPGQMTAADGGWRLTGRWKIVSGADLAGWFMLAGMPSPEEGMFFCLVPRDAVTVLDTWHVAGMRGSDSNTVVADDVLVPADYAYPLTQPNRIDRPAYKVPTINLVFPGCAAVLIGMAQAAIDELVALAPAKNGLLGAPLATMEKVQTAVGRSSAQVAAARGLLLATTGELDRVAASGQATTDEQRAAVRGAICLVTETARTVLSTMYELGSSDPLYIDNRLGRIFRDGMAAAQAANLNTIQWIIPGRITLGEPAGVPFV